MTIPAPFGGDFPLNQDPYNSRLQTQIEAVKNYFMVAFKPGFPLQASELNEIQEIFYIQQTLTQSMFSSWHTKDYLEQDGAGMLATPWNGCTPLSPSLIIHNTDNNKITITADAGWYLTKQTDTNGGFGVWVYNPTIVVLLTDYYSGSASSLDGDYGMIIKQVSVNCTTNSSPVANEDRSLQDSSNINVINGPCGAARLKIEIIGFGKSTAVATGETFLPIINASRGADFAIVTLKNNYKIADVTD